MEAGLHTGWFDPRSMDHFECCLLLMAPARQRPDLLDLAARSILRGLLDPED